MSQTKGCAFVNAILNQPDWWVCLGTLLWVDVPSDNCMKTGTTTTLLNVSLDTIDHSILIGKLKLYGLDTNSLTLLGNYNSSSTINITYGTTQGSILGPLIFILYVNDTFKTVDSNNSMCGRDTPGL